MRPLLDIAPVREVQAEYVNMLWENFGHLYEEMVKHDLRPWDIAHDFVSKESRVAAFAAMSAELIQTFLDFWRYHHALVDGYLRRSETMKSYFGGDISPVVEKAELSAVLLYTDTVILECPILRLTPLLSHIEPTLATQLLIKHVLNIMRYADLALAEVEPPILVFASSPLALDFEYGKSFLESSEPYIAAHARTLLGMNFTGTKDVESFVNQLNTVPEVMAKLVAPSKLLFDTEWKGTIEEQITRSVLEYGIQMGRQGTVPAGEALFQVTVGRMRQANELARLSSMMGATPLITAPTSWQYLMWRYEYDAVTVAPGVNPEHLVISNAILSRTQRNEFPLIANLSTEALIILRSEGALDSMRSLLRTAVNSLNEATSADLGAVSRELTGQVGAAFGSEHAQELENPAKIKKEVLWRRCLWFNHHTGALTLAAAEGQETSPSPKLKALSRRPCC